MRVRLMFSFVIVLITGCARGQTVKGNNPDQARLEVITAKLANGEIGRIEIFQRPPYVLTRTRLTPDMLEKQFDYKFTIHDIRGGAYRKGILEAANSIVVEPQKEMPDLRWGVIFYGLDDVRVGAMYFDKSGRSGALGGTRVSFKGNFFKWLDDNFSRCFRSSDQRPTDGYDSSNG